MTITTGKKSFADVYFGENAIKVLENSVVEVKQLLVNLQSSGEQTEVHVEKGQVFSKVSKKLSRDDSYRISTPTTIAAIRGTDFLVSEKDNQGHVACLDGKVAVKDATVANSEFVEINGGQEVNVNPGKPLSVQELDRANKQMIQDILKNIRDMQADIRKRFEEEREKIREEVRQQKEQNREMVQKAREENKQRVEDQKASDKANIDAIKGGVNTENKEIKGAIESQTAEMKGGVNTQKDESKKTIEGVKPDVKKFSIDVKKPDVKATKENK
jgi:hypothetical protein